jgi:hypothetical protein
VSVEVYGCSNVGGRSETKQAFGTKSKEHLLACPPRFRPLPMQSTSISEVWIFILWEWSGKNLPLDQVKSPFY